MRTPRSVLVSCGLFFGWIGGWAQAPGEPPPQIWFGPSDLVLSRDALYVAGERSGQIAKLNLPSDAETGRFGGVDRITGLSCSGERGFVTRASGGLSVLDLATGEIRRRWELPPGACAPLVDRTRLFVCDRFGDSVIAFDASTGQRTATIAAVREPIALAVGAEQLVVLNLLPAGPATGEHVSSAMTIIDRESLLVRTNLLLPPGGIMPRGVAIWKDQALVVHSLARFRVPTIQISQGWMNSSAVTVVDLPAARLVATILLDEPDRGAANPWAVGVTDDGLQLVVAHAGTHELSVIDLSALWAKIRTLSEPGALVEDLAFLRGIRRRVALSGKGPRALALSAGRAYVSEFFSDSIAVVDLKKAEQVGAIKLGDPSDGQRIGEHLFHDASIGYEGWQSCASCHPDGRADGLNWDLLNDGIGNPKNTKSLLLSHQTPPVMSLGVRVTAEAAVRSGLRHILFTRSTEEQATAIDEYLRNLKPVASPHLVAGGLSEAALRGKDVFERPEVGCAVCHPAPLFTDLQAYDVGTANRRDRPNQAFDTPTLIEVWRTAPYLHDGSQTTIRAVLKDANAADGHGKTSHLRPEEMDDLVAYVLSL